MSQKLIIAILGVVIIVGGGAWYYQTMSGSDSKDAKSSRSADKEKKGGILDSIKSGVRGGAGTFADILSMGDAQQCTFAGTDPETGEYSEGKIYINGESFRLEANTEVDRKKVQINMIQHEKVMYMWSDDEETMPGIKIDVSMFEDMEGIEGMEEPESPIDWLKDPESDVDYNCDNWIPRSNIFEPPKNIEFMDMFSGLGAMFQGMMQGGMMEGGFEGEAGWDY